MQNNLILVIKFPLHKKDYGQIEKQNNISIDSVPFNYEDETPYIIYTLKQSFEKYINLLLLTNSKNFN